MRILFTGGGTGGHLFPIIAISRELRKLYQKEDLKLYYLGPKDKLGWTLLYHEKNFKIYSIISGKIRRYFSFQNITDVLFKIPWGFIQSFFLLLFIRPKLVFGKGGSGSLAVTLAAKLLKIPIFLHESDFVPGLSNIKTSKWAEKIFISFPQTEYFDPNKVILVGNPIRKELLENDSEEAKEILNLSSEKPIILVMGGSQGAEPLNNFILIILNDLLKKYEVIHVCGIKNYGKTQVGSHLILNESLEKYYHLYRLLDEVQLKSALKAANLIISRAGSGSIFEIAALGKPSILIPLPSAAGNHQSKNAYQYAQNRAAIVIEQENLTPNFFMQEINRLLSQPEILKKMSEAALKFSKPEAAENIAREILKYLNL